MLGNSQKEYDKLIVEYSIRNQLRHKGNLVRHIKKDAEAYYDALMKYSSSHLMLFPYHLADVIVTELRITPFNYYIQIISDMIVAEKSYDSLPNFTAADAMRLLGIGRNQYIELMNQNRSNRRLFRRVKPLRELLPMQPVPTFIEPWWQVHTGCILESDIKSLTPEERHTVDLLLDLPPPTVVGQQTASLPSGLLDLRVVQSLFHKGLVYFDVPVADQDYVYVGPLDGFVMNRVLGDYFETLLYKIFVTINDETAVTEIAPELVDCDFTSHSEPSNKRPELVVPERHSLPNSAYDTVSSVLSSDSATASGRVAFLFDSSLTAFLMMGNLSSSLKGHAVTLFEVGKLTDEQLNDFLEQLEKVNRFAEGEAQRYSEHATTLLHTLKALRTGRELDLVRGESLHSLDSQSRARVLHKTYSLVVSMAPLCIDACTLPMSSLPLIGPPIPEVLSPWLRLAVYSMTRSGPPSIFLPRGTRLTVLPRIVERARRFMISCPNHEPLLLQAGNVLQQVNDLLLTSPLFLQEYYDKTLDDGLVYVPFPFADSSSSQDSDENLTKHAAVVCLRDRLSLGNLCGYIVLAKKSDDSEVTDEEEERETVYTAAAAFAFGTPKRKKSVIDRMPPSSTISSYVLLDVVFGVPLFDEYLNAVICERMRAHAVMSTDNQVNIQFANKTLVDITMELIEKHNYGVSSTATLAEKVEVVPPVRAIGFDPARIGSSESEDGIVVYSPAELD